MADGKEGEISMNYAIKNAKNEWEVLRLYTLKILMMACTGGMPL